MNTRKSFVSVGSVGSAGSVQSIISLCLLLCSAALLLNACSSSTNAGPTGTSTTFNYTGKDSNGVVFVRGTITIPNPDSAMQNGTWKFDSVAGIAKAPFGPQFGTGTWVGALVGSQVILGLNPGVMDNNVSLSGTVTSTSYNGLWNYSTLVGQVNRGSFEAIRQ